MNKLSALIMTVLIVAGAVPGSAQDKPSGDSPIPQAPAPWPILVEPGPTVESTLFDGSVIWLETQTVTRLMCGSDGTGMTLDDLQDMVVRGRAAFAADPDVVTLGGTAAPRDGGPRTGLNIVFNVSSPPPGATAAFDAAAAYIESIFNDAITVSIDVIFADLGGNILGSTSSDYAGSPAWSTVRSALVAGVDPNDTIQAWLPLGATIPVRYDGASGTVTNETRVFFTRANYNAGIGSQSGSAAFMQFNNTFPWDYDPSNGVGGGSYCFQSVIIHEVTHALGFVSGVDFRTNDIEALDLYRFQRTDGAGDYNPDTEAEFQTSARLASFNSPDDDHNSDLITVEYRMSDGDPYQASHFRQDSVDGIMQPAVSPGTTFYPNFYRQADLDMLDAIGWDYAPEPGTTTLPFFDDFPSTTINAALWTGIEGAQSNGVGMAEPSALYSLDLNGSSGGGDRIRTAIINTSGLGTLFIEYYWQRRGGGESPETGDDLVVEYYDNSGTWVELARYLGSGSDMTTYTFAAHTLTAPAAFHPFFRMQFRAISSTANTDDWFVDNVSIETPPDAVPPTPNPMTFDTLPTPNTATPTTMLDMVATTASDPTMPVQYAFEANTGPAYPGADPRDWGAGRTYSDTGLTPNTTYVYRAKARDGAIPPNETTPSANASAVTYIETPTGVSFGTVTSNSIPLIATGTLTNIAIGSSGVYFDSTTAGGDGGINAWVQTTTDTATGLTANTQYTFQAKARNQSTVETPYSGTASKWTLALVPTAPTLGSPTSTTMTLNVNPNGNPAATTFAIRCTAANPNDVTWASQYVNALGHPSGTAVWQTDATWGTITINGLPPTTTYTFAVKARNGDLVETAFGPGASLATLATGECPILGDINMDGMVDGLDIAGFVRAKLGLAPLPGENPACADYGNGDLNLDIADFVAALLG